MPVEHFTAGGLKIETPDQQREVRGKDLNAPQVRGDLEFPAGEPVDELNDPGWIHDCDINKRN
jgi:hypothetical protein